MAGVRRLMTCPKKQRETEMEYGPRRHSEKAMELLPEHGLDTVLPFDMSS